MWPILLSIYDYFLSKNDLNSENRNGRQSLNLHLSFFMCCDIIAYTRSFEIDRSNIKKRWAYIVREPATDFPDQVSLGR